MEKYFIPEDIIKSVGARKALGINEDIKRKHKIDYQIFFPDINPNIGLPTGSTSIISTSEFLDPSFIGHDIGCGYKLTSVKINPETFQKKKSINKKKTDRLTKELSDLITTNYNHFIGKGNHFVDIMIPDIVYSKQHKHFKNNIFIFVHSGSGEEGYKTFLKHKNQSINNSAYIKDFKRKVDLAKKNRDNLTQTALQYFKSKYEHNISYEELINTPHNQIVEFGDYYRVQKGTQEFENGLAIIAGNPTDFSYIVSPGRELHESLDTINHGCGRLMDTSKTKRRFGKKDVEKMFRDVSLNVPYSNAIEQAPAAYRSSTPIVNYLQEQGLVKKVARLKPISVIMEN
ncbi:MAG: RtcB family protein [Candidatus Woesearchaeota archaeon]